MSDVRHGISRERLRQLIVELSLLRADGGTLHEAAARAAGTRFQWAAAWREDQPKSPQ